MYKDVVGLNIEGGSDIVVQPHVLSEIGPGSAMGSLETPRGTLRVAWRRNPAPGTAVSVDVLVPPGPAVRFDMPLIYSTATGATVTESGSSVWSKGSFSPTEGVTAAQASKDGKTISFTVGSGSYSFELKASTK